MAQTQDLILRLKSKHVLTARCLMSLIGLLASMEKMVPEGRLHMRPFQFHLKEHWRYPQSLDSLLPWTESISAHLDWWQNPVNVMKGSNLHPKDHSIQLFTDASNEDHDMVPSLSHNIESQTHSRVSECDGRPPIQVQPSAVHGVVTASTGVQTDLPQVVHSSCRPVCHSSEPQTPAIRVSYPRPKGLGHRCSEHKLDGSHCLCLPSNGSPSQGDPKHQAMPLPDHSDSPRLARDALILGPSATLNRDSTTTSVNNPSQTVPPSCVPQQSTTSQPPRLVSRSGQLQEQGFSVGGRENCCPTMIINKDHLQVKVGPI